MWLWQLLLLPHLLTRACRCTVLMKLTNLCLMNVRHQWGEWGSILTEGWTKISEVATVAASATTTIAKVCEVLVDILCANHSRQPWI